MHQFITATEWQGGERLVVRTEGGLALDVSSPPVFGGEAGRWTPEDMLVGGVEACILLTTMYFVNKNRIGLKSWTSRATGDMEKGPSGLRFKKIEVSITARVAAGEDVKKLTDAVQMAEKYCPLSAAVNFPVSFRIDCAVQQ